MKQSRKYYILGMAIILGFLISLQSKSFENVNKEFQRDVQSNIFQEINILKSKNESLQKEVEDLENGLSQFADQKVALQTIESQIEKYTKLSGKAPIFGPGTSVTISGQISTQWAVDLVNAFFNAGAEAVSLNGIRLVNDTLGFDTLPQGQILLNGSILSSPYVFNAIGESSSLTHILELPGGILNRISAAMPGLLIEVVAKDIIQMN